MSEIDQLMLSKLEKVEDDIGDIKINIVKNTSDLEVHIRRTNELQSIVENLDKIVEPLYKQHISEAAILEFRKQQREDLVYKLKLPAYIVAALAALGTVLTWIMSK